MNDNTWKGNILIVDDTLANLQVLRDLLRTRGYKVRPAPNAFLALRAISVEPPEVILLDIKLPDLDGYEVCKRLKADETTREIPIIFISALYDERDKVLAFECGGSDYVVKPFQAGELVARIENQLRLTRAERQIRFLNSELEARVLARTADLTAVNQELESANAQLEREISAREFAHEQLRHQALRDPLTGLPNRTMLLERLEYCLQQQHQDPERRFALLFLDLDRFKAINDSLGHAVGDRVLVAVAQKLQNSIRNVDLAARLGGDEFVALLTSVASIDDGMRVAQRLSQELQLPVDLGDRRLVIAGSIGIVLSNSQYASADDLLRDADLAMYRAKTNCGSPDQKIVVFNSDMYARALQRLHLERDLNDALEREEFHLHFQPTVALADGCPVGVEALVRWHHPTQGIIMPDEFIPVAEETGLIVPLDRWVLQAAADSLLAWRARYPQMAANLRVGVNFCARDLQATDLLVEIDRVLTRGLPGFCLVVEITEGTLIENITQTIELLEQLKSRQIHVSIDDFGTGYSSLSYLHRLPVDSLKIDRSFVGRMHTDRRSREIVETIITLGRRLGVETIAEGIETARDCRVLAELGCDLGQGYYFSRPLCAETAEEFLFGTLAARNSPIGSGQLGQRERKNS